jgi:hypothetical protein
MIRFGVSHEEIFDLFNLDQFLQMLDVFVFVTAFVALEDNRAFWRFQDRYEL